MEFFTIGNFITLGIVGMALFLYRQIDRHSQSMNKVQKYAAQLKQELTDFVAEKEGAVKDYAIALDVQQKSAKELMRRLQTTDEEMAVKAAAVAKIDERLSAYDASLEELVRMTVRVQENLNRIREESAFVEKVNKRIGDSREKFEEVEQGLAGVEQRFREENAAAMEKIVQMIMAEVSAKAQELQEIAELVERRVGDSSNQAAQDLELIKKTLEEALERAAIRADKMEDTAVIKLREQAIERVQELQATIEEALNRHHEKAQDQLNALQSLAADYQETWKNDAEDLKTQHHAQKEAWNQDLLGVQDRLEELKTLAQESQEQLTQETALLEQRAQDMEQRLTAAVEDTEQRVLASHEERLEQWKRLTAEAETNTRQLLTELEGSSRDIKTHFTAETDALETRLQELELELEEGAAALRNQVVTAADRIEKTVLAEAESRLEQWRQGVEERDLQAQDRLTQLEASAEEFKSRFIQETQDLEQRLRDLQGETSERILELQDQLMQTSAAAQEQAAADMDARIEQWKEAAEAGDQRFRQTLLDLETLSRETEAQIAQETAHVTGGFEGIQTQLEDLGSRIETEIARAEERGLSLADQELEKWKEAVAAEDQRAQEFLSRIQAAWEAQKQGASQEMEAASEEIQRLKTMIEDTVSQVEVKMVNGVSNAEEQALLLADRELEKWKHAVDREDQRARELAAQMEASLGNTKQQVTEEITQAEEQFSRIQTQLGDTLSQIEQRITQAVAEAQSQAASLAAEELEKWKQAAEERDKSARELLAEVDDSLAHTKNQAEEELAETAGHIETLQGEVRDLVSRIETELTNAVTAVEQRASDTAAAELAKWKQTVAGEDARLRELLADLEASLGDAKAQIAEEATSAAGQFERIQAQITEAAGQIRQVMTETLGNAQAQASALAAEELTQWKQTVEREDARLRELLADLEASLGDAKAQIAEEVRAAAGQFEGIHGQITETAGQIRQAMTETLGNAEAQASAMAAEELEKWREAVAGESVKIGDLLSRTEQVSQEAEQRISQESAAAAGQFEELQNQITHTEERIRAVMAEAVHEAEAKALTLTDRGLEKWRLAAEEGDLKARQLFTDLETASAEAKQYITREITVSVEGFESLQARIQEIQAHIEAVMTQAAAQAEEKALTLTDNGLAKWREAAEAGDLRARQLFSDLERVSSETKQRVFDEITAAQGQFETLQQKIGETASQIEGAMAQAVSQGEEKAGALAGAGLETWRAAIAAEDAKTQELIQHLKTASEESARNLGDLERRLAAIREHTEQQAIAEADQQMERCKQAVHAADTQVRQVLGDLEAAFGDTKKQLFEEIAQAETRMGAIQTQIDEAAALLDQEMTLAVGKSKEKALLAVKEEDAKVRQVLEDLEAAFEDTKKQLFEEIAQGESRMGAMHNQINETYSRIDQEMTQAVAQAESQGVLLAEAGLEKWKASIAEEEAQVRQLLADLDGSAEKNERNMADLEQRLTGLTGTMEQRVLEAAEERLEQWKRITLEAETNTRQLLTDLEAASGEIKTHFTAEQTALEQRLRDLQDHADKILEDLKTYMEKTAQDTEQQALEAMDARLETWKDATAAEDLKAQELLATLEASSGTIEQRIRDLQTYIDQTIAALEAQLKETAGTLEQKVLEETDTKFEEYRKTQTEQFRQLETLADDAEGMDRELRRYMGDIENRIREDFAQFEQHSGKDRERVAADFNAAAQGLKTELDALERELEGIKDQAYRHVSEEFQGFEEGFFQDIAQRKDAMEGRLAEWQESLNGELAGFKEASAAQYRNTERAFTEELRRQFEEQHERLGAELERLKDETSNFEEGIRAQMKGADDTLDSFKTQLHQDIAEARNAAEASVKAELGRHALSMAEQLKQSQRDLEIQIKKAEEQVESRNQEITGLLENSRQELDRWQTGFTTELQKLDLSMNEARRRAQELITESDERLSSIRSAITDVNKEASAHRGELFAHIDEQVKTLDSAIREAERHIKDFTAQTRLFERTDELKVELERRLEDLRSDFDRIDQRRTEAQDLEGQFVKIKRLEDEVNAKMTRFLSEKHRIEQMETEFSRLLQVSTAVEEKLTEVSNSDDTLQGIQIQIRKLKDALEDAEEKYQRIEKKNQTLDATNDGIDRNFKSLQESEKAARFITDEVNRLSTETGSLRTAIQSLTAENTRARETADKLSLLDASLSSIEERIEEMQKARQWLARAETRLEDLNKQSLDQVKMMDALRKEPGKSLDEDKGAPPIGVRENIIRLARLGWTVDEISRAVKISRGEVELILEIMPKD